MGSCRTRRHARVNLMSGQIDIDFAVFNIYQYDNANLTGHYTGPMTME